MIDLGKHSVLGVHVDAVDYAGACARILSAARAGRPLAVSALAVHGVMTGVLDREHRYRLNHFDLIVPDGQPVRWALNWLHGAKLADRVYGPNLMLRTCQCAAQEKLPIFLFGGTDELLQRLSRRLIERFPKLQIAGTRPSAFRRLTAEEQDAAAVEIGSSGAKIAFVGLGCPRQEVFAFEMRDRVPMPLLAVGAAFNFHAGLLPQAPPSMQRYGLEWLYRLINEPKRLWRRYLILNPLYSLLLGLQWTGLWSNGDDLGQQPTEELRYG